MTTPSRADTSPAEAERLGFTTAIVPPGTPISPGDTVLVGERWF